jgi:hypothetical protein
VGRAALIAVLFYVVASAWSLSRWRTRLREEALRTKDGQR